MSDTKKAESPEKKDGKTSIVKILQYGAAVLSFVSFLTTANGMQKILEDQSWQAFLISFGIQVIVLVFGTKFFEIRESIFRKDRKWLFRLMVFLYACAIGFSSTFSYVFLSSGAYKNVQTSNYNIELEQFLVKETKNLKNTNDAAGREMLSEIQTLAPEFRDLNEKIKQIAQTNAEETVNSSKPEKYTVAEIPPAYYYNADNVINRLDVTTEGRDNTIRGYEGVFIELGKTYETQYGYYSGLYDAIDSLSDAAEAKQKSELISQYIEQIKSSITQIQKTKDGIGATVDGSLEVSRAGFISTFSQLQSAFEGLKTAYDAFTQVQTETLHDVDIQSIYNTIYSPEDVLEEEIDDAITNLKNMTTAYLDTTDSVDDELIQSLSTCIIYLGEFKKYQTLDRQLEEFETEHLRQVYIIKDPEPKKKTDDSKDSEAEEDDDAATSEVEVNPEPFHKSTDYLYNHVSSEEWTRARQEDLATFVRLVKTLPDVELLVQTLGETKGKELRKYSDYVDKTLKKAYLYEHRKLAKLNTIETALNYLFSKFWVMALFSLLVAVFMDVASFLIGLALHFMEKPKAPQPE